ncbi:MAG: ABC transporter ATP-binding protein, partial [Pseudomonadota bacterium]
KEYNLPFADRAVGADLRSIKEDPAFGETKREILEMIWEMEEEIMGKGDA